MRHVLGKHAPQFAGFRQQDAQELLAFLMDGLHEGDTSYREEIVLLHTLFFGFVPRMFCVYHSISGVRSAISRSDCFIDLNRVKKKKYREYVEKEGQSDVDAAAEVYIICTSPPTSLCSVTSQIHPK